MDQLLTESLLGIGGVGGEGGAGAGDLGGVRGAAINEPLGDYAPAAGFVDIAGDEITAGLEVDEDGGALVDGLEIVDRERHFGLASHGEQVQHGVGGAAGGS